MNNDIRKLVDDNWDEIKELIAQKAEAEQNPKSIWDLETKGGREYYRIEASGGIEESYFEATYDEYVREVGNAFLTREEAEFEVERRKIEAILRKYSRSFKSGEYNYVVVCDTENNMILVRVAQFHNSGGPVFANKEVAEKVIDEIGKNRLKKYWFGVAE